MDDSREGATCVRSRSRGVIGAAIVALVLALGCSAEALDVHLELADDGCAADALTEVRVISVEIYGSDSTSDLCTLARRCIFVDDPPDGVDAIAEVLRTANQPLVDAELQGAEFVHVVGRTSCWGQADPVTGAPEVPSVCGSNDLAEVDGDTLALTMRCDPDCPSEEVPLCGA